MLQCMLQCVLQCVLQKNIKLGSFQRVRARRFSTDFMNVLKSIYNLFSKNVHSGLFNILGGYD